MIYIKLQDMEGNMPSKLLTKSKYISGLQCLKYLWIQINEPERIPETGIVKQHIFDQGHLVGELAKKLFPGGIDIPTDDFMGNIRQTKKLLNKRKPIYEAGILTGNLYSRTDILNPVNETEWDIIEVKSSTSVKDVHVHDASFQKYSGVKYDYTKTRVASWCHWGFLQRRFTVQKGRPVYSYSIGERGIHFIRDVMPKEWLEKYA